MLKFERSKTVEEVRAQCIALGLTFNDAMYKQGGDYIRIAGGGAYVMWRTFPGTFFGKTDTGIEFDSSVDRYDSEPWMQALLRFFYVEKKQPQSESYVIAA